ncbi:hypothetical protein LUZ60_011859 [Juncus effusus]|nr:hypothetical protein LUZ60_011859 [Juncus effusus]
MASREEEQSVEIMEIGRGEEVSKYLPRMPVRVLLVEGDDSTRQIIAALLRKCSYRVVAASDGMKAWETLKEKSQSVDLVLTEVELPFMSGFGLLSMIMEHQTCKNIPVIMMSSHDSMSMVFKCMLKGAADFLVKPIRKNELRNLWQHVWRRQIVNGGNLAQINQDANFPDLEISDRVISEKMSEQNANLPKSKEMSEQRSDAQSSCTRSDIEAESKQNNIIQNNTTELENKLDSRLDLSINNSSVQNNESKNPNSDSNPQQTLESNTNKEEKDQSKTGENLNSREDNLSGTFPHLELSLRRFEYQEKEERNNKNSNNNKLNHSNSSPFSLYNTRSKPTPPPESQSQLSPQESRNPIPNLNLTSSTIQDSNSQQPTLFKSVPVPAPAGGISFDQLFRTESSQGFTEEEEQSNNVQGESLSSCVSVSNGGSLGNLGNSGEGFVRVLTPREMALNKFRLKRKERCFEKKVRYQSRKLLAEKRPRIKGQFVRQEQQSVQEA